MYNGPMVPMHVLLADVHVQVRWALRTFLQEGLGFVVVGEVHEAEELLSLAEALRPDLIFLEWELPGLAPCAILAALSALELHGKVIVIGQRPECQQAALAAGADAFLCKTASPDQVRLALVRVMADGGGAQLRAPSKMVGSEEVAQGKSCIR